MNSLKSAFILTVSVCAVGGTVHAQTLAEQVRVNVKAVNLGQQQTPQMQAPNLVDKRWKPKNWLEIEAAFDIELAPALGGKLGSLSSMDVTYYIALNARNEEGKTIVLTGSVNYRDVPADSTAVGLAFVSPATLKRVLKREGSSRDVAGYGCEVTVGGERKGFFSSMSKTAAFWFDPNTQGAPDSLALEDGAVLPKAKTPFAPFWGDYDLPVTTTP